MKIVKFFVVVVDFSSFWFNAHGNPHDIHNIPHVFFRIRVIKIK